MWDFLYKCMNQSKKARIISVQNNYSYSQIIDIVNQHASKLKTVLPSRSKCAVLCNDELNTAIAILTCWCAEMIPIPMSKNYGEKNCKAILDLTKPNIVITDDSKTWINSFTYNIESSAFLGNKLNYEYEHELQGVAMIMCTSGTTGMPKGVMITTEGLKTNLLAIANYFAVTNNDTILIARPLYHCAVLTGEFLISLYRGLDIIFYNNIYNPMGLISYAQKMGATVLCGTPTLFNHISTALIRHSKVLFLKKIVLSGECLNKNTANKIRNAFPNSKIYNVYGLTEASPRVSYLPPQYFDSFPESVGIPLNGIQIRIADEKNECLPIKAHGQIMIKTPCIMKGYYNNEKATCKAIVNGWLNTGDIGYQDENGYLYILSRTDDMIIKGGMNIYPKEIENQVLCLDQIKECVVYGVRADVGQSIAIDVVLNDTNLSKKELMVLFSNILPTYQMPTEINIVDSLERNASGKVMRGAKSKHKEI